MPRYFVYFSDSGAPATGLTPTSIWRTQFNASPGTAPTIVELDNTNAPGWYFFDETPEDFADYIPGT